MTITTEVATGMKTIEIIREVNVDGRNVKPGETITIASKDANYLLVTKKAKLTVDGTKPKPKPKSTHKPQTVAV